MTVSLRLPDGTPVTVKPHALRRYEQRVGGAGLREEYLQARRVRVDRRRPPWVTANVWNEMSCEGYLVLHTEAGEVLALPLVKDETGALHARTLLVKGEKEGKR